MLKKTILILVCLLAVATGLFTFKYFQVDFQTLSGDKYRWQQLEGQWVVVNYFAQWCAPCLKEIPELNKFDEYAVKQADVSLFAVSYDPLSAKELAELRDKYQMQFDLISTVYSNMPNQRPRSLPATFLISPQGDVIKQLSGEQTAETLQQAIEYLKTTL